MPAFAAGESQRVHGCVVPKALGTPPRFSAIVGVDPLGWRFEGEDIHYWLAQNWQKLAVLS